MKKILSLLLLASALGFVACDESDPTPGAPSLSVTPTTASDLPGETITVTASIIAPGGAKTLSIAGGITQTVTLAGETSVDKEVDLVIPANAVVGSSISAVFSVQDNSNQSSIPVTLTITVGNPVEDLPLSIAANMTLDAGKSYLIRNQVVVKNGATLTIPAGTILMGDKATKGTLVIEPGGKLVANGTANNPIVFTSAQPKGARDKGDWGGIVWMGNAYVNQQTKPSIEGITPTINYGTVDVNNASAGVNDENNGSLTYARIEYAGIELTPNNETNGLTMGALGSATVIDYVQSSYGGDDAFEWFGGTVNAKHLVALATWDDDFDTDFGWRGHVQWGVAVRAPFSADQSGSTSFESDSQGNANAIGTVCTDAAGQQTGCTQGVFSNITVLGPRDYTRTLSANYTRAMHIRRRTAISIFNSVITGYPIGITMDDQGTVNNYAAGAGVFKNNVLFVPILPTSASNPQFASGNAYYSSNVGAAASGVGGVTGSIADLWEGVSANTIVKGLVATKSDNVTLVGNWGPAEVAADHIIYPYENYWPNTYPFYAASTGANYPSNPAFAVATGNLVGLVAANLFPAASKVDITFFEKVTYKGAFGDTDWTDGWSEFQPQNHDY